MMNAQSAAVLSLFAAVTAVAGTVEVGTVAELQTQLSTAAAGTEIVLKAEGSPYDLSTEPCMKSVGHLYVDRNITLRGATGDPDDVVLVGSTNRILYYRTGTMRIHDLTFRGGDCTKNAKAATEPKDNQKGGAMYFRLSDTDVVVSNCVFDANRAPNGGAVAVHSSADLSNFAGTFIDCVFTNNVATSTGGAAYGPKALIGCTFSNNEAQGSHGGAVYQPRLATDCDFIANQSANCGGALFLSKAEGASDYVVSNCTFKLNRTVKYGGAIAGGSVSGGTDFVGSITVTDCWFEGNVCTDKNGRGGAAYGVTNGLWGCTYVTNSAQYGANLHSCMDKGSTYRVAAGTECYLGLVVYKSKLIDADVTLSNTTTRLFDTVEMEGCRITGTCEGEPVFLDCSLSRCRLERISRADAGDKELYLFGGIAGGTASLVNCLLANCELGAYFYNITSGEVVNCTVVSNDVHQFAAGSSCARTIPVVNTLFYRNKLNTVQKDIDTYTDLCIVGFTNSVFAAKADEEEEGAPGTGNLNYYGTDFNPKFVGVAADPANPYSLKRTSPLVKEMHGVVQDWMLGATDIRGEGFPRLREGVVDIGCYQCWLKPSGLVMVFR